MDPPAGFGDNRSMPRGDDPRRRRAETPSLFDAPPPARSQPEPADRGPARSGEAAPAPAGPARPPAPADERPWTVSALTAEIASSVGALGRVRVEGEVSDLRRPGSGHLYFQLKDAGARISCAVWKSQLARIRVRPREGDQVVATGRLDVYAPRGTYSLMVDKLEPVGVGALLARLEELKAELRAKGWFERKRPTPARARLVGVVTSRDGAALRDFLRTRSLRWPGYPVRLAHTAVQGPGAAQEIAAAIERLTRSGDVDLVVVCRGGGSLEDLWAFNELPVAAAIRACPVPVITGVGHETDTTLADLVGDLRAHTPTDAALCAIPDRAELLERLDALGRGLDAGVTDAVEGRALRVAELGARRVLRDPAWIVGDRERALAALRDRARRAVAARRQAAETRLGAAHARLERRSPRAEIARAVARLHAARGALARAVERRHERARGALAVLARGLEATSPLAVLARGYSVTTRAAEDGARVALVDASDVAPGDRLETRLSRGRVVSRVEEVEPGSATATTATTAGTGGPQAPEPPERERP
jgi:exodeoxyribonuclease VII large subunit